LLASAFGKIIVWRLIVEGLGVLEQGKGEVSLYNWSKGLALAPSSTSTGCNEIWNLVSKPTCL